MKYVRTLLLVRDYYFSLLQKRRLDSLHGAGSGEYARLLLELTGNADAALRSELERERERRLQALIVRVKLRMLTEHFEAFVEYMRRCFYVKEKFAKMLARTRRLFSTLRRWRRRETTHTGRPQAPPLPGLEEVRLHGEARAQVEDQGLHAPAAARGRDVAGCYRPQHGAETVVPRLEGERRQADEAAEQDRRLPHV